MFLWAVQGPQVQRGQPLTRSERLLRRDGRSQASGDSRAQVVNTARLPVRQTQTLAAAEVDAAFRAGRAQGPAH